MGSFITNIIRILSSTDITSNYVSLQNSASYFGDGSNSNQSSEKCFEVMEKTSLITTNNCTNVTSNDQPLQIHPTYTDDGSNCNQSKDKTFYKVGDEIKTKNMAKVENLVGNMYIGATQHVSDEKLDPLKIFEDLTESLLKDAQQRISVHDRSDDQKFSLHAGYVSLQISLFQQNKNKNTPGHLHTRQEIINSHKKADSKNIEPEKFFETAENYIRESDYYQKIQSAVEKNNYLKQESKIIGVIGQAGVGKSTLVKNLFQKFVDKKQLYQCKYVLKIDLRNFYDKSEISLFQFLLGENACGFNEWTNDKKVCKQVFKLLTDCEYVCILLDGLDEAKLNPENKVNVNANNFLKQTPGNFLLALLCGQLLPKAKLIITSRPGQMLDLPSKYKPKFILTISGITQQGVKQICKNMCGDDAPKVYSHIQNQPDLKSYTIVPINCVLIVHCIYKFLLNNEVESLPYNMTGVFVLSFFNFLGTNHNVLRNSNKFNLKNLNHLKNISQLAWSGLRKRQFHFDDKDLKDADLDQVDISSVTVTVKHQDNKNLLLFLENATSNCTYFSHLLIQEFFSAIYCLFFMDSKTFENAFFSTKQFDLQSNEFSMLTKFLFGLSNSKTLKIFNHLYPKISDPTEHIKLLKDLAEKTASTAHKIEYDEDQFRSIHTVCSWLYEFQDSEFSKQISANLPTNIVLCGHIVPSDVLSFCYVICLPVIKIRTKYLSLEIDNPNFVENALRLLLNGLQFIQTNSTVQIKRFDICLITINDEEIELLTSLIYDGIKEIKFDDCYVTARGMKKISTRLSNLTRPLNKLKLDINIIDETELNDDNKEHANNFIHLKYKNKQLELHRTNIGDETTEVLCDLIFDNTQEIELHDCTLTRRGMKKISTRISNLTCPLQSLNLSGIRIGDSGFESVATCVHKINKLSIGHRHDEDLTLNGVKALVEGIKNSPPRLQSLDLSEIEIGDSGFESVATCIHKINQLIIGSYADEDLTLDGVKALVEGIKNSPLGLQSLDLRRSKIGDSCFESVATCVHKINQLSMGSKGDEDLTLDGVKALVEGIKASPLGMEKLCIGCPDKMESVVRQELLGLKNKVGCVKLNWKMLFDDRST